MGIRSKLRDLHRRFQPLESRRFPCRFERPRGRRDGQGGQNPDRALLRKRQTGEASYWEFYSDDLYTSKLLDYLEQGRESGQPFFAYVAYTTAHAPLQAPDFLIDKYYDHYFELGYEGLKRARFESQKSHRILPPEAQYPSHESNPLVRAWAALSEEEKQREARMMATYSAMMESQDYHIGMLLNYLQETGEIDNTLIIYMSDNGPEGLDVQGELANPSFVDWIRSSFSQEISHIGRGDAFAFIGTSWANASTGGLQWWKWFIGEGGIRVPMIIIPPKAKSLARAGQLSNEFVSVKDVPMTILDYAGVQHPMRRFKERKLAPPSGVSMRAFVEGRCGTTSHRRTMGCL